MFILPTTVAMSVALLSSAALAAPPQRENFEGFDAERIGTSDSYVHPLGKKQDALKQQALEAKVMGMASGKVHEVAKGQYVELEREGEDLIWTVLAEFSDVPFYDPPGLPGPQRNMIPQPDRTPTNNNSTIWVDDFDRDYYMETLFADGGDAISMRNYYIEVSSNRYAVDGDVTDWGKVLNNQASYGRYDFDVWYFVSESLDDWYTTKVDEGWTPQQFEDYLSQFDVWDRYDYDGDGDFDEPDGYIDHFQSVHAGEGEEAGGGAYGSDAIWSHRWYAFYNGIGSWGPGFNLAGGVQIGDTAFWVGDYTIEPENGGVGVFAHEFGHDLGLPDLYNTGGGPDNSVAYWSLMASGSWTSQNPNNIGSAPIHMGAWEKFQLGWLNYEVAFAGAKSEHKLGPAETNTKQAQGLFVVLPQKYEEVTVGDPFDGEYFYFSGSGNDLDNMMYREFTLAPASSLTAKANVQIEIDWDYAYLIVSDDGGANWTNVSTNLSTNTDPNGQNFGEGITGDSGGYVDLTADLSAFVGDVLIGFRYWTDVAAVEPGFAVDNIAITGAPLDDAESEMGWTYDGFVRTTGSETLGPFNNYYIAEFRQYRGYDMGLATGPYNFIDWDWVERYPYQDGLLISYWDTSQGNNNTATHPGKGLILPIDAHPEAMPFPFGGYWSSSKQSYDSTFGLDATDAITLHTHIGWGVNEPSEHPSLPAVPVFDDRMQYWNPATPAAGVMNPNTGTQIRVKSVSARGSFMQVQVKPAK